MTLMIEKINTLTYPTRIAFESIRLFVKITSVMLSK